MKRVDMGTSLMVQLKLCAPKAEGMGSIPSQRTRAHIPQLEILHAANETRKKRRERGDGQTTHKPTRISKVISGSDYLNKESKIL